MNSPKPTRSGERSETAEGAASGGGAPLALIDGCFASGASPARVGRRHRGAERRASAH